MSYCVRVRYWECAWLWVCVLTYTGGRGNTGISGNIKINPLNAKLNPICHLLALLVAHHIFHVSGLRVKLQRNKIFVWLLYGCEILSVTHVEERRLRLILNSVLRKMLGLERSEVEGGWGKLHNEELCNLFSLPDTTMVIKWRGLIRGRHVARIGRRETFTGFGGVAWRKEIIGRTLAPIEWWC